jgi:chromosome segregation ATPase
VFCPFVLHSRKVISLLFFQSQLNEQTETVAELQSRLQSLAFDHDRRLTSIQQTHEEEKQLLLNQLQETGNQMRELEKDLYFYKHKTRELRKAINTRRDSHQDDDVVQQQSFHLKQDHRSTSTHQS